MTNLDELPQRYDAVIDKLLDKSEAGSVPWKPTAGEDTFIAAIEGGFTFEVGRCEDAGFEFRMKDNDDRKIVDLRTSGGLGWRTEGDQYSDKIGRLFEVARGQALEVDRKLAAAESLLDRV